MDPTFVESRFVCGAVSSISRNWGTSRVGGKVTQEPLGKLDAGLIRSHLSLSFHRLKDSYGRFIKLTQWGPINSCMHAGTAPEIGCMK